MSDPLIVDRFECGMAKKMPRARPNAVFVLSYRDGTLRSFSHAPGFADRTGSRWCFVVDRSQRFSADQQLRIPANDGVHHFEVTYDAAWQVTDAEAVVRADLAHGEPVVAGCMQSALWPVGRNFGPSDASGAEAAARRLVRPPVALGTGLTLNGVTIRMSLDSTTEKVRDIGQNVLELKSIVGPDVDPILLMHLAQHPENTGFIVQLLNESRDKDLAARMEILDKLIAADLIGDADGDQLRSMVFGGQAIAPGTWGTGRQGGPAALPPAAPAIAPPTSPSAPGGWGVPALGTTPTAAALPAPASTPGPPQPTTPTPQPPPTGPPAGTSRPARSPGGPQDRPGGVRRRPTVRATATTEPSAANQPDPNQPVPDTTPPRPDRPEQPVERAGDPPARERRPDGVVVGTTRKLRKRPDQ